MVRFPSRDASTFVEAFRLLRVAAPKAAGWTLVLDIVGAASNALLLLSAGQILGLLAEGTTWGATVPALLVATVALAATTLTTSLHDNLTALAAEQVEKYAVGRVLGAASRSTFASFDAPLFYDQLRRAHESGKLHAWSIVQSTLSLMRGLIGIAAIVVLLTLVAPFLIVVSLAAYVPLWIVSLANNRSEYQFSWDETEDDRRRSYIESLLGDRRAAKEVRLYNLGETLTGQYASLWNQRISRLRTVIRVTGVRSALGALASSLVVAIALGVVVWLTVRGELTLEQAGIGVLGVRQLSNSVSATSRDVESLHRSRTFLRDYHMFSEAASNLELVSPTSEAPARVEQVSLSNVSFTYPGATSPSLKGAHLVAKRGEITAIVGSNGSGKTTLLMLLAGLYEPDAGTISWNKEEAPDLHPSTAVSLVAPLFQDFMQYHFTIRENVTLGDHDPARLAWALDVAQADEFVRRLPKGIETQLGKDFNGGIELSTGQWQRLALARSLYLDAPILLLDEPASALDPTAESELMVRLRAACPDTCVVIVSHRFVSVRHADHIYVLDEGRVIEQGAHDDLIARSGAYSALFEAQSRTRMK